MHHLRYLNSPGLLDELLWPLLVACDFLHIVFETNSAIGEDVEGLGMPLKKFDELENASPDDRLDHQISVVLRRSNQRSY